MNTGNEASSKMSEQDLPPGTILIAEASGKEHTVLTAHTVGATHDVILKTTTGQEYPVTPNYLFTNFKIKPATAEKENE